MSKTTHDSGGPPPPPDATGSPPAAPHGAPRQATRATCGATGHGPPLTLVPPPTETAAPGSDCALRLRPRLRLSAPRPPDGAEAPPDGAARASQGGRRVGAAGTAPADAAPALTIDGRLEASVREAWGDRQRTRCVRGGPPEEPPPGGRGAGTPGGDRSPPGGGSRGRRPSAWKRATPHRGVAIQADSAPEGRARETHGTTCGREAACRSRAAARGHAPPDEQAAHEMRRAAQGGVPSTAYSGSRCEAAKSAARAVEGPPARLPFGPTAWRVSDGPPSVQPDGAAPRAAGGETAPVGVPGSESTSSPWRSSQGRVDGLTAAGGPDRRGAPDRGGPDSRGAPAEARGHAPPGVATRWSPPEASSSPSGGVRPPSDELRVEDERWPRPSSGAPPWNRRERTGARPAVQGIPRDRPAPSGRTAGSRPHQGPRARRTRAGTGRELASCA